MQPIPSTSPGGAVQPRPGLAPAPPLPRWRGRLRYLLQWIWIWPIAIIWWPIWALLTLLWVLMEIVSAFTDGTAFDDPPGLFSGRRFRWRRKMWLSRARLRRSTTHDVAELESALRARLDLTDRSRCTAHWKKSGHLMLDRSYFRQIGVHRAVQIAQEYGYHPSPGSEQLLPHWLVLDLPKDAGLWLETKRNPSRDLPPGYEWITTVTHYDRFPGRPPHLSAPPPQRAGVPDLWHPRSH